MIGLLERTPCQMRPDASRTLPGLFVPGQETLIRGEPRVIAVIDRVLGLSEEDVETTLAPTLARFSGQSGDLAGALERHFQLVAHRLASNTRVGRARRPRVARKPGGRGSPGVGVRVVTSGWAGQECRGVLGLQRDKGWPSGNAGACLCAAMRASSCRCPHAAG